MPDDFPEGTILIEIRGVYDGWSCAKLPDGSYVNRWEPGTRMFDLTQTFIEGVDRDD
jgi:hypothetical protein